MVNAISEHDTLERNIMKHVMVTICHATYQLYALNLILIASLFNSYLTSMWVGLKMMDFDMLSLPYKHNQHISLGNLHHLWKSNVPFPSKTT